MVCLVASKEDIGSLAIKEALLEMAQWKEGKDFLGHPTYSLDRPDLTLFTIPDLHLFHDHIDRELGDWLGEDPMQIVVLSRHSAASGKRTLTVHPIGNYGEARYGGRPSTLAPSSPHHMSQSLRILHRVASDAGLDYEVSFEVTHHGPYLETPIFFIEMGSTEEAWKDKRAAMAIARTLLELEPGSGTDHPVAIGVGGGHYAPRFNDVARKKRVSFGHMIPNYALEYLTPEVMELAIERTPGVELVYFHRKSMPKPRYRELSQWFQDRGLEVVRESDLEDLD